ncbi:hypothetical protein YC2023_114381 [Brassica napus]
MYAMKSHTISNSVSLEYWWLSGCTLVSFKAKDEKFFDLKTPMNLREDGTNMHISKLAQYQYSKKGGIPLNWGKIVMRREESWREIGYRSPREDLGSSKLSMEKVDLPVHNHPLLPLTRFSLGRCKGCWSHGYIYGGYRCNELGCDQARLRRVGKGALA